MTDRAQTEVLGYILVFSIVVLAVALVTVSGQSGLVDVRENQRAANVERGFVVLADNVDDVVRGRAPSRATELSLSGESLALGDPVTMNVSARDPSSGAVVFDRSLQFRPVVYATDDGTRVVYASGAVIRQGSGGGAALLREPSMLLSTERTVVSVVNTTLEAGSAQVDRESRVLLRTVGRESEVVARSDSTVNLTVTVTSPRAAAWESYLETEIDPSADDCTRPSPDTVSCTFTTDRVSVVRTRVGVSFR